MDVDVMMALQGLIWRRFTRAQTLETTAWDGWFPQRKNYAQAEAEDLFFSAQEALGFEPPPNSSAENTLNRSEESLPEYHI